VSWTQSFNFLAVVMVAAGALQSAAAGAANGTLWDVIRQDDTRALRMMLKAGADPSARDDIGATPLMHAAAFASADAVKALLDGGADTGASSSGGATALMWATGDIKKVRLLLDRGAAVNARMRDGTTALVTAARRGQVDVMRLLLARGAAPRADANEKNELLRLAYGDHPETRQVVADAGISLDDAVPAVASALASYRLSQADVIDALLKRGANPNPRGRFPVVGQAAIQGHLATTRLLVDRGANLDARGTRDVTPLMMAAAAPHPDTAMVQLLLTQGRDAAARDQAGRTALDWALLQGETPAARLLRGAGVPSTPLPPSPSPVAQPRTARAAVSAALDVLRTAGPVAYEKGKCVSCHHQALPLMAMTLASAARIPVDTVAAAHPVRAIADVWNSRLDNLMIGREVGGGANELTYGLLALAQAGVPPNTATDAAVVNLASTQRQNGSWVFLDTRPPQADNSPIPFTAMAIRVLGVYGPPALRKDLESRRMRAREFLRMSVPGSTQDAAFKLLGLVWSKTGGREITDQSQRLVALQRPDGGWGQMSAMASDAYATGQALYALNTGGMATSNRAYQSGVAFLLRTQLDDGTWFVRSRAFAFQPYFESGFPHGPHQFISASATAWAVIALTSTL
jgi:ankyrin repeat protein